MQADPKYADEIRMEPGAYNPKKDLKGKAKETEAFEGWVDSVWRSHHQALCVNVQRRQRR